MDWGYVESVLHYMFKYKHSDILDLPLNKLYSDYEWANYFFQVENMRGIM